MRILFGLFGWLTVAATLSSAQPVAPPVLDQQLQRAENFLNNGDYERAALLLERYYPDHQTNPRLYQLLKNAYFGTKEYDKLEKLVADRLTVYPKNRDLHADQIELFLRKGEREKAGVSATGYIAFAPRDSFSYSNLANRYLAAGYVEEALGFYLQARKVLLKPVLFAFPLAETFRSLRRWREALEEYLLLLQADPANSQALFRATSLISDIPPDDSNVGPFLDALLAKKPDALVFRFKGDWELRKGNLDAALGAYQEADRRGAGDGFLILDMARRLVFSNPEKVPGLAAWFEKTYPKNLLILQMHFSVAEAQTRLGNFPAALAGYEKILASPLIEDQAQSLLKSARLFLDYAGKPDSALARIEKLKAFNIPPLFQETSVLEARARAAKGDFDRAKTILAPITGRSAPWGEEIDFLLAEWDFYFLNFEEAEKKYSRVVDAYPRGLRGNDALRRLALLKLFGTARETPLAVFASWLKDLSEYKEDEAEAKRQGLEPVNPALAAEALFNWGLYLGARRRDAEAAAVFEKLAVAYPQSPQVPLALEKQGELAEWSGRAQMAVNAYEKILENYPEAINVESVRGKLRRLGARFPKTP